MSQKQYARQAVSKAVRLGKLAKPNHCTRCSKPIEKLKLHGHHPDYTKRLEVVWLCSSCHATAHYEMELQNA